MSDPDKFEIQGRAHAALKVAKSNVATLTLSLREKAKELTDLGSALEQFLIDPGKREQGALKPQFENLQEHLRRLNMNRAIAQLEEIFMEAGKARRLQEEIEKF